MISCKPHIKCILKCALDISCLEMEIYTELLRTSGLNVETIAQRLNKDYNTVYKALRNLMEKGLVKREYRILRSGGYQYIYKPIDFKEFKEIAMNRLKVWINEVSRVLDLVESMKEFDLLEASE